jgi:hypothetical protein
MRYFPEKFNTVTSADEIGMLQDIERISGESLLSYKKRILESSTKISNSSYSGLINGINRELGLSQKEVVEVNLKKLLKGNISDPLITHTELIISDNRYYEGIIDGIQTTLVEDKITDHVSIWPENYLAGLTLTMGGIEYAIRSNTTNVITLDRKPIVSHINDTYIIRAAWVANKFVGFALIIDRNSYEILANTSNTLTLNKPLKYRSDLTFYIRLNRPRIKVTASRIIFYKEFLNDENYQLDLIVSLRDNNMTHRSLCKLVNFQSQYFEMKDLIPYESEIKAFTLIHKDSDIKIFEEFIPSSKFFRIKEKQIKPGTIKFSESSVFSKEEDELNEELFGPYYTVNYEEGTIQSNMLSSGVGQISYTYMDFPFTLDHAPAAVISLSDKESQEFLFSQQEKILYDDPRDRFVSSQPKVDMIEYIAELLRINKQSWGK